MSNTYFQFKSFIVNQENTAMKVCTDACLFGAWVADSIKSESLKIKNILDIGTGTGLLALMLAQKTTAHIDAVELNGSAVLQAQQNFEQSNYKDRLSAIHGDITKLQLKSTYDLIITNPPFYQNDLKSEIQSRNDALHSTTLHFDELLLSAKNVLSKDGLFAVLLAYTRTTEFISLAEQQSFSLLNFANVSQTEKHSYFRSMLIFSYQKVPVKKSDLIIKINGSYSDEFIRLLQDYYLYL